MTSPVEHRFVRLAVVVAGLVAGSGYGALLIANRSTAVGGSDSSGYANTARAIASGRLIEPIPILDELGLSEEFAEAFRPLAFEPGPRPKTFVPYYPPGFPLHIALATRFLGRSAGPFLVSPLAAVGCLLLMFLLGRQLGLSRALAFAGAAILGGCAVFLFQAVQAMGDIVAALWAMATILFALRSRREPRWALATGAALGVAVLVRPANVLLAVPVALALGWRPRTAVLFFLGGVPAAVFFMAWNHALYGAWWRMGYSGQLGTELALAHFAPRFWHYGRWVLAQLSPLIPLGWIAVAADRRVARLERAVLIAWLLPYFVFYCFWGPYEIWWYTRYLLPAIPAAILGFLLVLRDLVPLVSSRFRLGRLYAGAFMLLALLSIGGAEVRAANQLNPIESGRTPDVFPNGCREVAAKVGGGKALVVSMEFSGAVRYYTNLTPLRWDLITPAEFQTIVERAQAHGTRIFALLLPQEIERARLTVPGRWVTTRKLKGGVLWELDVRSTRACPNGASPAPETCNGLDDDCNGVVDDLPRTLYSDESVPLSALRAKNPDCTPTDDSTWLACNNAIHLRCRDIGCRSSGVGSLEWGSAGSWTGACLTTDPPREVASQDLQRFGACPVSSKLEVFDRFRCARAIHGFCSSLGYASGFGPVAAPNTASWTVVCLRSGHATAMQTSYQELRRYHESCTGQDALKTSATFCMTAAKRYCVDNGYIAGYGPVDDPDGRSPTIICLDN